VLFRSLTTSQFAVLEALFHHGSLSHKELADKILRSSGNITLVIDNLEKRELVCRHTDPDDRRKMLVSLCAEGDTLIRRVLPSHLDRIFKVFNVLNEGEIESFSTICKKLGFHATSFSK
jgi:MarR family 2-MHQ and catechol resistance regulon transcriptional repressor